MTDDGVTLELVLLTLSGLHSYVMLYLELLAQDSQDGDTGQSSSLLTSDLPDCIFSVGFSRQRSFCADGPHSAPRGNFVS
jgi:hypothetical protein